VGSGEFGLGGGIGGGMRGNGLEVDWDFFFGVSVVLRCILF
jgi:hypothetical protein